MPAQEMIQEGESKDVRDKFMKANFAAETRRRYFNPFFVTSMIFFSILIAFVAMIMIIIMVFLNQAFSGLGSTLK